MRQHRDNREGSHIERDGSRIEARPWVSRWCRAIRTGIGPSLGHRPGTTLYAPPGV